MRHRRGADFAGFRFLCEVTERDIAPDVAVEIEQDRVRARVGVEQFRDRVVRLDLDRVRIEFEAEILDEAALAAFARKLKIAAKEAGDA